VGCARLRSYTPASTLVSIVPLSCHCHDVPGASRSQPLPGIRISCVGTSTRVAGFTRIKAPAVHFHLRAPVAA
jgi:hypothetical protein